MLRILERYLLREVLAHALAVTLVLWAIVIANRFARYLAQAASGEVPSSLIFSLLGLKSIPYLATILPLALFLGAILGLGRLHRDHEIVVMQATGGSPGLFYRPVLVLGLFMAALVGFLSLQAAPYAAMSGYRLLIDAQRNPDITAVVPGRFQEAPQGDIVFFAERIRQRQRRLENVFVRTERRGLPVVVTARRARLRFDPETGQRYLLLEEGWRIEGEPGRDEVLVSRFSTHGLRMASGPPELARIKKDALPTGILLASSRNDDRAELQWRLSLPVATLLLLLLAVPLTRSLPREGRYAGLLSGILFFIVYYNLLATVQAWVERGRFPVFPGLWIVHLLPLAVILWLEYRHGTFRRPEERGP